MIETILAKRYAEAFFQIALDENKIEELEKDLGKICDLIESCADLKNFLYNPVISHRETNRVMEQVLNDEVSTHSLNFMKLLVDKGREKLIFSILSEFGQLKLKNDNIVEVEVTSAVPLKQEQKNKLLKKLEEYTGKKVQMEEKINSELLAGLKVRIRDLVVEDTLDLRLKDMYNQIAKNG